MSVEIHGPKGYEVQYLVTLWIALLVAEERTTKASVHVEAGEDAEISICTPRESAKILLQSKQQSGKLDMANLVEWLLHFKSRSKTEFLLREILEDQSKFVLFVTQSRCTDQTSGFLRQPGDLTAHRTNPLKGGDAKSLLQLISDGTGLPNSGLGRARKKECAAIAKSKTGQNLEIALRRILVWELVTEKSIEEQITRLLVKSRVPQTQVGPLVQKLLEEVRTARDNKTDLLPPLRVHLSSAKVDRVFRENCHTPRKEDPILSKQLTEARVLRLTGRAQSGKTHMGRLLTQAMQDQGVHCLETGDLAEATSFLRRDEPSTRMVLLDDPLTWAPTPIKTWASLSKFCDDFPKQHLLVVTAKYEQLQQLDRTFRSDRADMFNGHWQDLTATDREFLLEYWASLCHARSIPASVTELIEKHLSASDMSGLLQPGQLRHLAYRDVVLLEGKSTEELLSIARFNARQLARELALDYSLRTLTIVLGVAGAHWKGVSTREIAFLCSESNESPALPEEEKIRVVTFGKHPDDEDFPVFPRYQNTPILTPEISTQLYALESAGYITQVQQRVYFTHPDYREAFQQRAFLERGSGLESTFEILQRSLGALDPCVGISGSTFVCGWLNALESKEEIDEKIGDLAIHAFEESIFPDVRATMLAMLLQCMSRLSDLQEERLFRSVRHSESDLRSLVWSDEMAWIHDCPNQWADDYFRLRRSLPEEKIPEILQRLSDSNSSQSVSGFEADAVNTALLREREIVPTLNVLCALLNREEVFIRVDAVEVAFSYKSVSDQTLRDKIFDDVHPLVVARGVQCVFEEWRSFPPTLRDEFCARVEVALNDPAVAVLSTRWLFDLGDEYGWHGVRWGEWELPQKQSLWEFWLNAVGAALKALESRRFWMNSGHLYHSICASVEWVKRKSIARFVHGWLTWIEYQTRIRQLDDYAVGVAAFLLKSSRIPRQLREQLTIRLFEQAETDVVADSLVQYLNHWSRLSQLEHKNIVELLNSDRVDGVWFKSIVLMHPNPPLDLVRIVTGVDNFFARTVDEKVRLLEPAILSRCVQMLYQGVGYSIIIEVHEKSVRRWEPILRSYLWNTESDLIHRVAVNYLVKRCGLARKDVSSLQRDWASLCKVACRQSREIMFDALLRVSLNYFNLNLGPLWARFFATVKDKDEKENCVARLAENIEGLGLASDNLSSVAKLLGSRMLFEEVFKLSVGDGLIFSVISVFDNSDVDEMPDEQKEKLATFCMDVYKLRPPRLFSLHDNFVDWLRTVHPSSASDPLLSSTREAIFKRGREQRDRNRLFWMETELWQVQSHSRVS